MIPKFSNSPGFAILYAVLMVSIVLTISLTLLDISYKQLILSSINKESKLAYYAAINALNCTAYWDTAVDSAGVDYYPFGSFTGITFNPPTPPQGKLIRCAAIDINPSLDANSDFIFGVSFTGGSYADVKVTKGSSFNIIKVDGYNTSDSSNPRRVQRSLDSN